MLSINPEKTTAVVSWDHRDQPDWNKIEEAIVVLQEFWLKVHFTEANTGSDEYAVILAGDVFDEEKSREIYLESQTWE